MRLMTVLLILAIVLGGQAWAYTPAPGDRAYPLVAKDLVSGKMMSLEDQRGKWVLLDVWASW